MFCKPDGSFTARKFDSIIRVSDGEALSSPSDYSVSLSPTNIDAKIVDRFVFERTDPEWGAFEVSDEIEIIYEGFTYLNTIDKVGEQTPNIQYRVAEKLPIDTADVVISFRRTKQVVTLNDISEGMYVIEQGDRGNELLIVRKTWMKPYIGYQELTGSFSDSKAIDDGRIKLLNDQALEEVYCDLSDFGNAYNFIYSAEIRTLQKYKILSILENDFETIGEDSFKIRYHEYLNKFSLSGMKRFDDDADGKPTGDISEVDTRFYL